MNVTDIQDAFGGWRGSSKKPMMMGHRIPDAALAWVSENIKLGRPLLSFNDPLVAPTVPETHLLNHPLSSNPVPSRLYFNWRDWNASTPPARSVCSSIPVLTPFGKLMGVDTVSDSEIGFDVHFLSDELERAGQRLNGVTGYLSGTDAAVRVVKAIHHLDFTNYSRFPVQVFIEFLRQGQLIRGLPFMAMSGTNSTTAGTLGGWTQSDISPAANDWELMDNVESFLVPPCLENSTAGTTASYTINVDPVKLFGPTWKGSLENKNYGSAADDSIGWNQINEAVLNRGSTTLPTTLLRPLDLSTAQPSASVVDQGLCIALSARLCAPQTNVGTHAGVYSATQALAWEEGAFPATAALQDDAGLGRLGDNSHFGIGMRSKWLCHLKVRQPAIMGHRGALAFPSQLAS